MTLEKTDKILGKIIEFVKNPALEKLLISTIGLKFDMEKYMPNDAADPRFITISGHLLIEKLLEDFVKSKLDRPEQINGKEINFRQLLAFAKAMQSEDLLEAWHYSAMRKLAELRDIYAHNLSPDTGDKSIEKFISIVKGNVKISTNTYSGSYAEYANCIITLGLRVAAHLSIEDASKK